MVVVYPVLIKKDGNFFLVDVPAFDSATQGKDMADAIYMARDLISLMGIEYEDQGKPLPQADEIKDIPEGTTLTYVDADLTAYRRKYDKKTVKKNCTIPSYLNYEAEKQGINFSRLLQEALMEKLGLQETS